MPAKPTHRLPKESTMPATAPAPVAIARTVHAFSAGASERILDAINCVVHARDTDGCSNALAGVYMEIDAISNTITLAGTDGKLLMEERITEKTFPEYLDLIPATLPRQRIAIILRIASRVAALLPKAARMTGAGRDRRRARVCIVLEYSPTLGESSIIIRAEGMEEIGLGTVAAEFPPYQSVFQPTQSLKPATGPLAIGMAPDKLALVLDAFRLSHGGVNKGLRFDFKGRGILIDLLGDLRERRTLLMPITVAQ